MPFFQGKTMNTPLTNITMPVFNRHDMTMQNIEALVELTKCRYTLTVVDNGSEELLRRDLYALHKRGWIQNLFLLDKNYGISCACNTGWKNVQAPFFMKFDNDIKVISSTWLEDIFAMWGSARYKTIFGPVWNHEDNMGKQETATGTYWNLPVSLSGQAFLVSAKVRDTIGYFCEDYGLYGEEDADYCLRGHHAQIRKYSYKADGMLLNMGTENEPYIAHGLSKKEAHEKNVGENGRGGIFALNLFLYKHGLRSLNVPLKYEMTACTDCHVTLKERAEYAALREKLSRCLEIHKEQGETDDTIEKIRAILH